MNKKFFYQVFESSSYSCIPVSEVFPCWSDCVRVLNRIRRSNGSLPGYRYIIKEVCLC